MKETALISFKKYLQSINWTVLIFLVLVLNVKLVVKIAALLIISLINRKKLFNKQILNQGIIVFYFSMIALVVIHVMLYFSSASFPYLIAATMSAGLWFLAALASYHVFVFTNEESTEKLHNTLTLFFLLHALFILFSFSSIVIETGSFNPYEYRGLYEKYFVSTGDYIRGINFDTSVSAAIISTFGVFYFLYRHSFFFSLISMICLLLTGSNLTNLAILTIFVFIFFVRSDKVQKSMIVVDVMLIIVFMVKISPHNLEYVRDWMSAQAGRVYGVPVKKVSLVDLKNKPDSLLDAADKRRKKALLYIDSISSVQQAKDPLKKVEAKQAEAVIDSQFYNYKSLPGNAQKINKYEYFMDTFYTSSEIRNIHRKITNWKKPGKWTSFLQIAGYYKDHPGKILMGNGAGNFSSRVAFKAAALNIGGIYPEKLRYINPDFKINHLYVYLFYHSQKEAEHTAVNNPDSVYGQLLSEYGVIGCLCFVFLYVGYFLKRTRYLTYGLPLLLVLAATFFFEYWFELLSITVLFEFMLLLNIKESLRIND